MTVGIECYRVFNYVGPIFCKGHDVVDFKKEIALICLERSLRPAEFTLAVRLV